MAVVPAAGALSFIKFARFVHLHCWIGIENRARIRFACIFPGSSIRLLRRNLWRGRDKQFATSDSSSDSQMQPFLHASASDFSSCNVSRCGLLLLPGELNHLLAELDQVQ